VGPRTVPTETCTLDVADRGGATLDEIGVALGGLCRERVRQVETAALEKLRQAIGDGDLAEVLRPSR
jgi:DNA-directed RNA polymerase sigma subunit (sigma70/sigma32)